MQRALHALCESDRQTDRQTDRERSLQMCTPDHSKKNSVPKPCYVLCACIAEDGASACVREPNQKPIHTRVPFRVHDDKEKVVVMYTYQSHRAHSRNPQLMHEAPRLLRSEILIPARAQHTFTFTHIHQCVRCNTRPHSPYTSRHHTYV